MTLARTFDYHLHRSTSPRYCRDVLVIGLSFDGGWQIHGRDTRDLDTEPHCIESVCGFGAHRYLVKDTELPDFDRNVLCEWCWRDPAERERVYDYLSALQEFAGIPGVTA